MATAQQEFDAKYISGKEIIERLGITRPTVSLARKRGLLPEPIVLNDNLYLWLRDEIEPTLTGWKLVIDARKGNKAS